MKAKRPRGRPRTKPEDRQTVHIRVFREFHDILVEHSRKTGIPMNTILERHLDSLWHYLKEQKQ